MNRLVTITLEYKEFVGKYYCIIHKTILCMRGIIPKLHQSPPTGMIKKQNAVYHQFPMIRYSKNSTTPSLPQKDAIKETIRCAANQTLRTQNTNNTTATIIRRHANHRSKFQSSPTCVVSRLRPSWLRHSLASRPALSHTVNHLPPKHEVPVYLHTVARRSRAR